MGESYLIPAGLGSAEIVEKRSRFLGRVWPVETEAEARQRIEETKKCHYDARHNCWCYVLREGNILRYSDDGEPQGTASQPMLNVFLREGVTNAVCVVTRYFGGILLGTGGLVRAYTQSAKAALDAAGLCRVATWEQCTLGCPYSYYERVARLCAAHGCVVEDTDFASDVTLEVLIPAEAAAAFLAELREMSAAAVTALPQGTVHRPVPLTLPEKE